MINSFGISEALVIGGVLLVNSGRVTEGFGMVALGTLSGFVRYTTWIGMRSEEEK